MKTVFLDANVLFSAAWNPSWQIHGLILSGRAHFVTSHYALAEARRNLEPHPPAALDTLSQHLRIVPDAFGPPPAGVRLPAKDIPILATAAAADADLLVTGDLDHFGPLIGRTFGRLKIILPRQLPEEI